MQISCGLITPTIWGFRSRVTRTGTQYISPPIRRNPLHLSLKAQAPSFLRPPLLPLARVSFWERERWCLCLSAAICTRCVGRLCHGLVYKSLHDDRPICDTRNPILPSWLRLRSTIHVVPTTWNRNCVNERWRYGNDSVLWGFMSVLRSLFLGGEGLLLVRRILFLFFFNRRVASFACESR